MFPRLFMTRHRSQTTHLPLLNSVRIYSFSLLSFLSYTKLTPWFLQNHAKPNKTKTLFHEKTFKLPFWIPGNRVSLDHYDSFCEDSPLCPASLLPTWLLLRFYVIWISLRVMLLTYLTHGSLKLFLSLDLSIPSQLRASMVITWDTLSSDHNLPVISEYPQSKNTSSFNSLILINVLLSSTPQ